MFRRFLYRRAFWKSFIGRVKEAYQGAQCDIGEHNWEYNDVSSGKYVFYLRSCQYCSRQELKHNPLRRDYKWKKINPFKPNFKYKWEEEEFSKAI